MEHRWIDASVFTPLCLGASDTPINHRPSVRRTWPPGPQEQRREGEPAAAVSCERWGLAQRMFVLPAGKHWQKCAHARLTLASRGLRYIFLLFFFSVFRSVELFCLPFHFSLGKTRRLARIQLINLDLSLEGLGLICYVLKTPLDFPSSFSFAPRLGRERLVLSPFPLRPNKSSRQPLTL